MVIRALPRILRTQPKFLAAAAGSLAVGIGLAAAFWSMADAALLRPLPVAEPARIVRIFTTSKPHPLGLVSYPDYEDLSRNITAFDSIAAQCEVLLAAGKTGETPRVRLALAVSTNYFEAFGVRPHAGRAFQAGDERAPVVMLSHAYWTTQWGGDPSVIGDRVELAGMPFRIVGVAPAGFGLDRFLHEDFYVPAGVYRAGLLPSTENAMDQRGKRYFALYARLKKGVSAAQAQAETAALAMRLAGEYADTNREHSATVLTETAARARLSPMIATMAALLLAAGAMSVAAGCANASGLMLLRVESRKGEIALRGALGASPLRLLREMLGESAWIGAAGIAGAVPVAGAVARFLAQAVAWPSDAGVALDARFDARVAAAACLATAVCVVACAAIPWLLLHRGAAPDRAASVRVTGGNAVRKALTVLQVALAMAMAATGGGLLHALRAASRVELGYRMDNILTMTFDPAQVRTDAARTGEFYRELLDLASVLPGVEEAALAQSVPFGMTAAQKQVWFNEGDGPVSVRANAVTPEYFTLMRMPVLEGRAFSASDGAGSPKVVIINGAFARLLERDGAGALGRRIQVGEKAGGRTVEVVGVTADAKVFDLSESPKPFLYLPFAQESVSRMVLHVKTRSTPAAMVPAILTLAHGVDSRQPVSEIRSLRETVEAGALFGIRIGVRLTFAAAASALALALAGLYAMVANSTARRRREIGIRKALGAGRGGALASMLREGVVTALTGVVLGGTGAAAATRWLITLQSGANGTSAGMLARAAGVVLLLSLAACTMASWKWSGVEPAVALRENG